MISVPRVVMTAFFFIADFYVIEAIMLTNARRKFIIKYCCTVRVIKTHRQEITFCGGKCGIQYTRVRVNPFGLLLEFSTCT